MEQRPAQNHAQQKTAHHGGRCKSEEPSACVDMIWTWSVSHIRLLLQIVSIFVRASTP